MQIDFSYKSHTSNGNMILAIFLNVLKKNLLNFSQKFWWVDLVEICFDCSIQTEDHVLLSVGSSMDFHATKLILLRMHSNSSRSK